jgi:hypothetical protein
MRMYRINGSSQTLIQLCGRSYYKNSLFLHIEKELLITYC